MSYIDFGDNLRKLRKSRGLTQKEFGDQIGLSKAVVSKYENSMGYPSFDILVRISEYLGVTTDYLLGIEKDKTVDASGLTNSQLSVIHQLIKEFREANKK